VTRVAIVEDDPKYRSGLAATLGLTAEFRVVDAFAAATPFLARNEAAGAHSPWDLVVTDLGLPDLSGIDVIRRFKQERPQVPVVALTVFEDPARIVDAICAGADGYLLKRTPPDELTSQLQAIVAGGSPLTPDVARTLMRFVRRADPHVSGEAGPLGLSERERDVLRLLAEGMIYKQVADELSISVVTVRTYVRRIYEKMQVRTVAQAVQRAVREGAI